MILVKLVSLMFLLKCSESARILGVFPLDFGSHYILGTKLMRGLAEAGHDITFISPRKYINPPKNGSWTDVVLEGLSEEYLELLKEDEFFKGGKTSKFGNLQKILLITANHTLRHSNVQKLFHSKQTFDAVIVDNIMNDCHHVFAYYFNCPLILLSSVGPNILVNSKVGNPNFSSRDNEKEITFYKRLNNFFQSILSYLYMEYYTFPQHNSILHEVFPDSPDIHDLYYNVSLILLNSHPSLTGAVPLVPNMIEVGGYYVDPPQKLPEDLQNFLDSAKDGAIYFSMGSILKSKDILEEKKQLLLSVFKKLKQKILWKFEEDLSGKPENVLIKKWFPQQDILAHPNIKLFITHGGLLSTTESIYHGVPVLAIPVFGDQEMNANSAVQDGYGLKISYNDVNFNEEMLSNLIQELLDNPKYRKVAQSRSVTFHDRPLTPLHNAVYWVEYVIRHKGAPHLRVAGIGMPWYKYFMVDVIATFIFSAWFIIYSIRYILKILLRICSRSNTRSTKLKRN